MINNDNFCVSCNALYCSPDTLKGVSLGGLDGVRVGFKTISAQLKLD